ncbi:hypothetical protein J2766_001194 [Agrobacterium tumefaciens]|uniref:Uncharacterized protein n=2 Tax=Agrobacterium tumefaciens TaxID=358 RepID=A0AAW8LPL9_AGRTU|nr:hypothetical protein [Agrobacterium tumefaciens]MBP2564635.1 hypothetical protein [Agrobacterium tumefaciens]MDR6701500.1 hypothetical protein [Agrobacterium tumefaciens]
MSNEFPNQFWDVYAPTADCDDVYKDKKLFADPGRAIPDEVLRNFSLEEKDKEIVMTAATFSTCERVALDGYAIVATGTKNLA